jgi:hypothetical protein
VHAPPTPPHGYAPRPMRVHRWHHAAGLFQPHALVAAATTHAVVARGATAALHACNMQHSLSGMHAAVMYCVYTASVVLTLQLPHIPPGTNALSRVSCAAGCWFAPDPAGRRSCGSVPPVGL